MLPTLSEMKTIPHALSAIALVAILSSADIHAADSDTPAPAKPAPAKTPPRAPTLVAVTIAEDDPDFAAGAAPTGPQTGPASATASAALDPAMTKKIQSAPLAQRDALITEIDARLNAARQALAALRQRVSPSAQRNGSAFVLQQAFTQARTSEQSLLNSLQKARESKTATAWTAVKGPLARNYGDYAKAVADLEATWQNPAASGR
jgi:hypothetical protein